MKVNCSNCGWEGEGEDMKLYHVTEYDKNRVPTGKNSGIESCCPECGEDIWFEEEEEKGIEMLEDERQTDYSYLKIDEDATLHETDGD